jgi:hypothetical protein
MPVPPTSQAPSRRRRPLGRVAAAFALFALAGSLSAASAATASAATASAATASAATALTATASTATGCLPIDQITSMNVPESVRENGIVGGDSTTVTMFFFTPTACATTIKLHNFNTAVASLPANIVVPAGSKEASFTVTTFPVSTPTSEQIIANEANATNNATEDGVEFTVEP